MKRQPAVTLTAEEIVEDADYLAKSGAGFREAAARMGMGCDALEARLRREGRADLYNTLRERDPLTPDWGQHRSRYERWAASPEGRAILHRLALYLERARAVYPDTERDKAARRLVLIADDYPGRKAAA